MGLVAKLKDKLHHGSSSAPPSDTEDAAGTRTPSKLNKVTEKVTEKLSHPGSGFSTPLSTESSGTGDGALAGAGVGESKHAVKMEKKREGKEERKKEVEKTEEKQKGKRGGEGSWAELVRRSGGMVSGGWGADCSVKAGPESTLLTENYGFLPLMQSSKEDREFRAKGPMVGH